MQYILFLIYITVILYAFRIYNVHKNTGFAFAIIASLFVVKVLAGIIHVYFQWHAYEICDVKYSFYQCLLELKQFSITPKRMLHQWLFEWEDVSNHLNFFKQENTVYWSSLGRIINDRFMLLCSLLSFGNIYINVIFYNVIFFIGQLLLYKIFYYLQPAKKVWFIISIFLLPSILFWGSGMTKDGFILFAMAVILYNTFTYKQEKKKSSIVYIVACLLLILCLRYFFFLCFTPFYFLWLGSYYFKNKTSYYVCLLVCISSILLASNNINSKANFYTILVTKQQEFLKAKGNSDIHNITLESNFNSFIHNLPSAINNVLFEPRDGITLKWTYRMSAIDTLLQLLLLVVCICYIKKKNYQTFYTFCIIYVISMLLFIGYTVPNLGALLRYKTTFITLLFPCLIALSEIPFLKKINITHE